MKHLQRLPHARVRAGMTGHDHGFLKTPDAREVHFHKNSLVSAEFDRRAPGPGVVFVEEPGEKGRQASTVRVVARRGTTG